MRVEWYKAIARANRFKEEVKLTVEEMRRTLSFFEWTAGHWEQLGEAHVGKYTLGEAVTTGMRAYATHQASLYHRCINAYVKDWYECLKLKALRSNWLKSYPRPIFHQRRQLQSNVTAYHPLAFVDVDFDQSFEALANDPQSEAEADSMAPDSDVEMDSMAPSSDIEVGFFDDT